jgi:hypothetical protein
MEYTIQIHGIKSEKNFLRCFLLSSNLLLSFILLASLMAISTASYGNNDILKGGAADYTHYPQGGGMRVTATFGPDERLWRIVPEKKFIYVDYSTDLGKTFSAPVRINRQPQRIKVSRQNRPDIIVDHSGRIFVIYTAVIAHTTSQLLSISNDNGRSFSIPILLSKKATEAISYLGRLALSPSGQVYVFWLDERDRTDWRKPGFSVYSTMIDNENSSNLVNQKLADTLCECCRIAIAFDNDNQPTLFTRFIYPDNIRDHGLLQIRPKGEKALSWRVTFDQWKIRGCPEQGPAISISDNNRYHIAWFTQGSTRQGLFYAYSSDQGQHFSTPLPFGSLENMSGYPDILANGEHVFLTWTEFDGTKKQLLVMKSIDMGQSWLPAKPIAESTVGSDIPFFLRSAKGIFVSWNSKDEGYRLIPLE